MWLKENIISNFDTNVIYGLKGDQLELIEDMGNILIVENLKGRFTVSSDKVSNEIIFPDIEQKIIINPGRQKTSKKR